MSQPTIVDPNTRHAHRRQAVRRQAQRHHWRFYKNRADWNFIQNFARAPIRWGSERLILLAATALVAVLAFVVLPGWATAVRDDLSTTRPLTAQAIALPPAPATTIVADTVAVDTSEWTIVDVKPGQTMGNIFASLGLGATVLHRLIDRSSHARSLVNLRPGDRFEFKLSAAGALLALRFDAGEARRVEIALDGEQLVETAIERDVEHRMAVATGSIQQSLFGAGERAGLSDAMIMQMATVFGYDIDFAQDLRVGDEFSVIYDEIYRDGEKLHDGEIVAASFVNQGKRFSAVRFIHDDGRSEYFSADGRSLRKAFLRTPVDFTRISSRFTAGRMHPILGRMRAHRGVDYAAPKGTPIKSAGDGKVVFRGWQSGYGNVIVVQHGGQYSTLYGHMSRFNTALSVGTRVSQGQVIGYVGMTGLATGPHLHYEFRVNGAHRDPLSVDLPKAEPLGGRELAQFKLSSQPFLSQLALLEQQANPVASR